MSENLSANYYQENNWWLQEKVCEKYQNLSEEQKKRKQQYGHERYKNLSENEKQKLLEYRKKYNRMRKNALL